MQNDVFPGYDSVGSIAITAERTVAGVAWVPREMPFISHERKAVAMIIRNAAAALVACAQSSDAHVCQSVCLRCERIQEI